MPSTSAAETSMEEDIKAEEGFVQRRLPWVIAAGALLFYLFTLSFWPNYNSITSYAWVSGLDWRPHFTGPLYFLLTYPIRWLPGAWQLPVLNLFSVVCAVLSLALLARSVALLPHDRTKEQRLLETSDYSLLSIPLAWIPPVFAVLVCGLQLTFWENAVNASQEALDLLMFAYVVRCLLEFRISQRDSWMYRAALVYGLGMANNVALVALLPLFLVAVLWIKGLAFFQWTFVSRMATLGLAGTLLYLLYPVIFGLPTGAPFDFWQILRMALGHQKSVILGFPRYLLVFISLTSLFPVLLMGIRWASLVGDISSAGVAI